MSFQLVSQAYAAAIPGTGWAAKGCSAGVDLGGGENITDVATIQGITCIIQNLLSPIPALLALVAVGMIIIAGIRLISAGSDPKAVASAWSMLTWAVIGLILLAGVWLVLVVIQNLTGAQVTQFGFPDLN